MMNFVVMGEIADKLSDKFMRDHTNIEWIPIKGLKITLIILFIIVSSVNSFSQDFSSREDVAKIKIIGVHPFNWMDANRSKWNSIFSEYKIQFLDRNTCFNDVNYLEQADSRHLSFVNSFGIPSSSYFSLHPTDLPGWSFREKYYNSLANKWKDLNGTTIMDPFDGGAAKDIDGNILKFDTYRPVMSLNNPYWLGYNESSIEFAIQSGIDAINFDLITLNPVTLFGGDYSNWAIHSFNDYLSGKYSSNDLIQLGITDINTFSIKTYNKNKPPNLNPDDILIKEYYKFGISTLLNFTNQLKSKTYSVATTKNKFIPFYGNLHIGHPSSLLYSTESLILGRVTDLIQVETLPAVPPDERTSVTYKIAQAMGDYSKPVWSLHQPFYGYSYEPMIDRTKSFTGINKLYLAEAYSSGAIPEIDLGGWPGISNASGLFVENGEAISALTDYTDFVSRNVKYFTDLRQKSTIGIIYSIPSFFWANGSFWQRDVNPYRKAFLGYAKALEEMHLPYDVLIFGHPDFFNDTVTLSNISKYDFLILPNVDCISNNQKESIINYVNNGGRLICIGDEKLIASRNEDYVINNNEGILSFFNESVKEKIAFINLNEVTDYFDNKTSLLNLSTPFNGYKSFISTDLSKEVGINVFESDNYLILHLVNYDYNFTNNLFTEKNDINIQAVVKNLTKVINISPDFTEEKILDFNYSNDTATIVIPKLLTWDMVVFSKIPVGVGSVKDDTDRNKLFDITMVYPNPSKSHVGISYFLNQELDVNMSVYNSIGVKVKTLVNEIQYPDRYYITWSGNCENGDEMNSGIFYIILESKGHSVVRKCILIK